MNRYFIIALLLFGFIIAPLMFKSVGCKMQGGTPVHETDPVTGAKKISCDRQSS